ncbi:MAG: hypothetical protein U1E65_30725 [Myxococcota bacterium]
MIRSTLVTFPLLVALGSAGVAAADEAKDFTPEVKLLYRIVACTGDEPLPDNVDPKVVEKYCKQLTSNMDTYRKNYIEGAQRYIEKLRPAGLPKTVVYPFGGGDLLTALTTYPDATDITTMSLEHSGDPRRISQGLNKVKQEASLDGVRRNVGGLLLFNDSKTESLQKLQKGEIPGELSFFLVGLASHGYEPVSLRYFRIEPDGELHYLTAEDIAAVEAKNAKLLHSSWVAPDFSEAFSNSEIKFKKRGAPDSEIRVHRHIAFNLANDRLKAAPGLLKYLEKKGRISAMTKAASYLLWRDDFSMIRDYLLKNMDFMISDSTGIPVSFAKAAGFAQDTYGKFVISFLGANEKYNQDFRKLWKENPQHDLPFRYGYIDGSDGKHFHLLVTRPAGAPAASPSPSTKSGSLPPSGPTWAHFPALRMGLLALSESPDQPKAAPRNDAGPPRVVESSEVAGGKHQRLVTSHGAAHTWRPKRYDARTAGLVLYVHGYWANVDQAWGDHQLAEQFKASERNALYVVVDSCADDSEDVYWKDLPGLMTELHEVGHLSVPEGPVIAVAHSGGFRTVAQWLGEERLDEVILLDGLYGQVDRFQSWVRDQGEERKKKLILISQETFDRADYLAKRTKASVRRDSLPLTIDEFAKPDRAAELLSYKAELDHMEIVTGGRVLPLAIQMTPLKKVIGGA